jgi:hypothetical protein
MMRENIGSGKKERNGAGRRMAGVTFMETLKPELLGSDVHEPKHILSFDMNTQTSIEQSGTERFAPSVPVSHRRALVRRRSLDEQQRAFRLGPEGRFAARRRPA